MIITLRASALALALLAGAAPAALHAEDVSATSHLGAWGFDLAGRDLSVKPGDDFFHYANGAYLKTLTIPADRSRYGSFDALSELSQSRVRAVLEEAAATPNATGEAAMIGAAYKAFMDEGRLEALDAKPLAPELAAIRAADTREKIAELMGRSSKSFYGSVFDAGIAEDAKDPTHYAVYLTQGGLGLPDRDYYLQDSFAPQRGEVPRLRHPDPHHDRLAGRPGAGRRDRGSRDQDRPGELEQGRRAGSGEVATIRSPPWLSSKRWRPASPGAPTSGRPMSRPRRAWW